MVSKKRSSKGEEAGRSPKGSVVMSLETATMLLVQSYLLESDATTMLKAFDSPLSPDEKEVMRGRYKAAIEKAAGVVSFHTFIDEVRRDGTAEGLIYASFIVRKMMDGKQNDNSRKTTDELMKKVWGRLKDTKRVKAAIKHSGINSDLLTPQLADKFYKKVRRKAPARWRAFVRRVPQNNLIQRMLIETLSEEIGL